MNDENINNTLQSRPVWRELFKTTEGIILLAGIFLAFAGLFAMGLEAYWSFSTSRIIGAMAISNVVFGLPVSISIGYASGHGYAFVILVNMWVETVFVLLFYPLLVLSLRKLVVFPKLASMLSRTHAAAQRHHEKVRRYGIFGLFMFVWLPFWMTGPVVGSAIGYLLGFPAWLTITIVLTSAFLAIGAWAYLLFDLYIRATSFGAWAPALIIGIVILIIIAAYALRRRKTKPQ